MPATGGVRKVGTSRTKSPNLESHKGERRKDQGVGERGGLRSHQRKGPSGTLHNEKNGAVKADRRMQPG